jgi:hypothetical protein
MFAYLKSLVSSVSKSNRSQRSSACSRKARLGVESLEGRLIPSISPMLAGASPVVAHLRTPDSRDLLPPKLGLSVENLRGDFFAMTSLTNGTHHTLAIQTQVNHLFTGTASFTGLWDGHAAATGTLQNAGLNQVHISFNFGTNHHFEGTISHTTFSFLHHIDGVVTVNGSTTQGPGHVVGQQVLTAHL